ncbi:MAG TPA: hypothetical protein VMQ44_03620 [Candidatus Saccharimonadales bacterium]|nr:hypothetical protein [Candidatus Saccharimonadales bacterium]
MRSLRWGVLVIMLTGLLPSVGLTKATDTSLSAYLNNQNYNNLVSDGDFLDIGSMSVADIQNFIAGKGGYLASAPSSQLGDGAAGRSAAQIIYDAARGLYDAAVGCSHGVCVNSSTGTISPKAILLTLQKEQSLVTRSDNSQSALDHAMGYGCPDSGGCDPKYLGFSNQVGWGAWQLRYNEMASADASKHSYVTPYYAGNVTTITDWDGARSVYFSDSATAALFRYTPHTYYGNYNFWQLGINWFGFGAGSGNPGSVNDTSSASGRMYASGTYLVKSFKTTDTTVTFNGQVVASPGSTTWQYQFTPDIGTHSYVFGYSTGENKTITIEKHKNGDINGDGKVDILDLSLLAQAWGQNVPDDDWRNLNPETDKVVNILDLSIFASGWGG